MTRSIMAPFSKFSKEGETIGRLLAGYSNIEVSLFHAVHVATSDFDTALKKMFGDRADQRGRAAWLAGISAAQLSC
jgi:hypothetical protein